MKWQSIRDQFRATYVDSDKRCDCFMNQKPWDDKDSFKGCIELEFLSKNQ